MDIGAAFQYFLDSKEAEDASPRTLDDYSSKLYRFAKAEGLDTTDDLNFAVVRSYASGLVRAKNAGELSSASVASLLRPVKVFCRWAATQRPPLVPENYFEGLKMPKGKLELHDLVSDEEFRSMLDACDLMTHEGRRNHAILCFLMDTGVRVGELTNLKVSDIDQKNRVATVYGKGDKERQVFWSAGTAVSLSRYLHRMPARYRSTWLWTSIRRNVGGQFSSNGVLQMLQRVAKAAGVSCRVNPHTFRHTFATNYLRAGGDLNSLMRLMGHADLTILQRYLSLVNSDLQAKHEQFSPVARVMARR